MPNVDVRATAVWLWRMRHPDFTAEWGMRIERPLMKDGNDIYVSATFNGHVYRSQDGVLYLWRAATLEPLLNYGEQWRNELRAQGWRDVEDE